MTEETQRCPWCSAELPASAVDTCPSCGAHLTSSSGAEPDIKGVTSLDPLAIIQARADVARPRNRIMSFITGEAPGESEPTPNPESLAPPDDAVRREMLRLELEAERADLEAESVALKTDVIVEQNISLADLAVAQRDRGHRGGRRDRGRRRRRGGRRGGPGTRRSGRTARADPAGRARHAARRRRRVGDRHREPDRRLRRPRYPRGVPDRLPHPGPSYLREQVVRIGDRTLAAGMAKPADGPDDWWLAVLWVTDADGVVSFRDVAPAAGPPPEPPLARLGPSFAGGLSGMIREEEGRLAIRLTPLVPPEDDARPWRCPARRPRGVPMGAGPRRDPPAEPDRRAGARRVRAVRRGPRPSLMAPGPASLAVVVRPA